MAHVVYGGGNAPESALYAAMFHDRKKVFVDLLHWDLPVLDGRFEIDQFDNVSTRYLICASPEGKHLGSLRLLPSTEPNLLGSMFSFLCDDEPPAAPDVWEISRLCLSRDIRSADRRAVRDRLATAVTRFALERGISAYCCIADMPWLSQILAFGWRCEPLGLPQMLQRGMVGALKIHIDDETPALMARAGIWCPIDEPLRELVN
jgi:acyl-homoserine lactone synthase